MRKEKEARERKKVLHRCHVRNVPRADFRVERRGKKKEGNYLAVNSYTPGGNQKKSRKKKEKTFAYQE